MEQQKKEMKEFLDDLTTRDQRMMFAVLTMVHTADSKEQLDNDTEALLTTARKHLCQFAVLKYQQMDGLNTAMPFGTRKIDAFRTLTTESLAVFIPFRVQDIYHENGIYYGQNVISKNMIIADRRQLLNGNSFILGVSGGGKSFAAKGEIENIILSSNADVIIIDPEREYSQLVKALGGEIINISATSPSHINAMDMNKEYGDGANPVILKSEFIMSLCEQLIGGTNLGAKQKSIIDRCTASVYRDYQQRGYTGTVPTLQDFRAELLKQDEPEAKEIALAIELFTHGSLNTFAKPTNGYSDDQIVTVALSQVGNVGGQPYWSWYGFDSRVEWCACFVSWCANECGYIDAGIIPKYAGCVNGVQWFRDRGQWADGSYEPSPGTIIFFDWEGDGVTDHTGIVQKCENGTVYTVEGNSGDTCRTKTYPVGSSVIYGYGIPAY